MPHQRPFTFRMKWHDLLFAHWRVPRSSLQPLIPRVLDLDTFDGEAWIGVVPFRMTDVGPRGLPALPGFSRFPELNVRTYVVHAGNPGVWFMSLDAASPLAVRVARWRFHLPYFDALMSCTTRQGGIEYMSRRTHRNVASGEFVGSYRPRGKIYRSRRGEVDHWLTERYSLYCGDEEGRVYRGDVIHEPWPLQPADAEIKVNTVTPLIGLGRERTPELLHFVRRLDVLSRGVERVM